MIGAGAVVLGVCLALLEDDCNALRACSADCE